MKKTLLIFLLFGATLLSAQKTVYIPTTFNQSGADDYCNKKGTNGTITSIDKLVDPTERWCKLRSYQTDNIVCFWEAGFGTDPTKMVNPANTASTFNLVTYLAECEKIWKFHVNVLKATPANGTKLNKYKFLFLLNYTTNWIAYGGGYDYTIGAMWLNPAPMGVGSTAEYPYFVLGHELFHSMSYQAYSDRTSTSFRAFQDAQNGPFWERSANFAACQLYPNVNNDFARYMYATQSHYLNTRKHYTTSFFLENLTQTMGQSVIGTLWSNNMQSEHPMVTARRMFFNNNQAQLNDFFGQTVQKNINWDYKIGTNALYYKGMVNGLSYNTDLNSGVDVWSTVMKKHRTILQAVNLSKSHFAVQDCQAPQDYGYNAIQLFPQTADADGSYTFKMHFKGHNEVDDAYKKSGWRWGFVTVQANGVPRYGALHAESDATVSFTVLPTDKEVWLVVTGAPTEHNSSHNYTWEAGFPKYYRYPYELRFENALPMGYNDAYEGTRATGAVHPNGGGWVASTAKVASTAFVGPHAKVLGTAVVSDSARIEDYAIVKGSAKVYGNARVRENAMVFSNASVYQNGIVAGCARVLNNSQVYGNGFVTDNAYLVNTKVYGDAIACGNLWQRDNTCEIGGTCVAGGDAEYMGFIVSGDAVSGPEIAGTFLQWPENANNKRTRKDKSGNLTLVQLASLRENWNNLRTRFSLLNNSISTLSSNPNYDINKPYDRFETDSVMRMDKSVPDVLPASNYAVNDLGDGTYLIRNVLDNTVLSYDGGVTPKFKALGTTADEQNAQIWKATKDTTGRFKIALAAADTIYLNAYGSISRTGYVPTYHSHTLYHRLDNNSYAIQRGGFSGSYFWAITKTAVLSATSTTYMVGQPFAFEPMLPVSTRLLRKSTCSVYVSQEDHLLHVRLPEGAGVATLRLYAVGGALLGSWTVNEGEQGIETTGLPTGMIVGQIRASQFQENIKFVNAGF
jgi:carbonic anhydrase/acetyltransferase-like protein (isoleucine patch superfamily)